MAIFLTGDTHGDFSRFKIEPLGCPSTWAFCRTQTLQKIR